MRAIAVSVPAVLSLVVISGASAAVVSVDWAGTSSAPASGNVLNAPNGTYFTVGTGGTTLGSFGGTTTHNDGTLAGLLGISASALGPNQIIGFEGNGGGAPLGGAWETSDWTFFDGSNTRIARFNELTGALDPGNTSPDVTLVAKGSFSFAAYNAYFGITPSLQLSVVSFVLFQLQTSIDSSNPAFTIRVAGVNLAGHEGSPDPDAIGVIRSVPAPGAAAMLGLGGADWRRCEGGGPSNLWACPS
jgi:hypothetical protein